MRAVTLLLGAFFLAGCAGLGPRVDPPTIVVTDVRLDRLEATNAWFVASVELANPNPRDIAVDSVEATITVEGESVANFVLARPVTVPAHGTAPAEIAARAGVDAVLRAAADAMRRSGTLAAPLLRYDISGRAHIDGGLLVPFHHGGDLGARPRRPDG